MEAQMSFLLIGNQSTPRVKGQYDSVLQCIWCKYMDTFWLTDTINRKQTNNASCTDKMLTGWPTLGWLSVIVIHKSCQNWKYKTQSTRDRYNIIFFLIQISDPIFQITRLALNPLALVVVALPRPLFDFAQSRYRQLFWCIVDEILHIFFLS